MKRPATSASVKALADKYCLQTGDQVPRPAPPRPAPAIVAPPAPALVDQAPAKAPVKWPPGMTDVFNLMAPAALSIVATDGPVSVVVWGRNGEPEKRYGHNRGIWPARVAKTKTWRDGASSTWDRNPFFYIGTQLRFWALDAGKRDALAEAVTGRMAEIDEHERESGAQALGHEFKNLGADLDLGLFELEIRAMAERQGAKVWDDAEFEAFLRQVWDAARAMQNRNGLTARLVDAATLYVMGKG